MPALAGVVGCVLVLLFTSANIREALINTLIAVLLCLSLVVITGLAGQISLIQVGLAGIAGSGGRPSWPSTPASVSRSGR